MAKIYIAGRFPLRGDFEVYADRLKEDGHEITASWVYGGENGLSLRDIALLDLKDVDRCDTFVLFTHPKGSAIPGGGRFVEFGYALAQGKACFIVGEAENVFCYHPSLSNVSSFDALKEALRDSAD